ncbi:NVEALA domain-containing protein [uncultured Phocaeicola sp.]|uniref:NVEALA domain-containing protein n=1 Tax=uncultured Phocaeicola sp. TaxID=990718 RepID=UPI00143502EC|nr:NVEALA domain-containing protein [uncultured Phocaeicola sp.]GFH98798.1 hypothetical protein IMSAGC004_01195 [Bacteroidaceae bacterium]
MKKSIWKVTLVIVFALMVGLNVYNVQKTDMEMSELALANVEALAGNEGGGGTIYCCGNYGTCMKVMDSQGQVHDVAGIKFTTPCPR